MSENDAYIVYIIYVSNTEFVRPGLSAALPDIKHFKNRYIPKPIDQGENGLEGS